jgi:hypothetical protein
MKARTLRKSFLAIFISLIAVFAFTGCGEKQSEMDKELTKEKTQKVQRADGMIKITKEKLGTKTKGTVSYYKALTDYNRAVWDKAYMTGDKATMQKYGAAMMESQKQADKVAEKAYSNNN